MTEIRDGDFTLFDHNFATGRSVWVKHEADGRMTFRVDTPVDQIIDQNAAIRNETQARNFGDWVRVASIPLDTVYNSGLEEANRQRDQKYLSRWLNDGDNRAFRTHEGKF